MTEPQSARLSKLTNDGLTLSGIGCFIAIPMWQQWASKGYYQRLLDQYVGRSDHVHVAHCYAELDTSW